ncbi:branched-chain amino acid ABC transporter permease (plasmid) [Haloferax sp. S1W]|uniref:branched-chain amino acid ABC transporter permease n=1 Tax=Haloferax sp. S1W TaxID=3377110 RepID=UPI0037C5F8A1
MNVHTTSTLLLQLGDISRFIDPFLEFGEDLLTLDPFLLQLLVLALLLGGVYALTALGLTMIFGVMDIINFAHGAFITIGIYLVWSAAKTLGLNPLLFLPVAVVFLFVVGAGIYQGVVGRIIEEPQESQLIAMFGVALIITSAIAILFDPNPRSVDLDMGVLQFGTVFIAVDKLIVLVLAITVMVAIYAFLMHTRLGLKIRATADDRDSARYAGIDIKNIDRITFGIGAGLAGLAGGAVALIESFDPFTGDLYLINAFVIVVLGGLGSFPGSFVGGMLVGAIVIFGGFYFPGTVNQLLVFMLFVTVLLLKPEGLFGGDLS